MLSSAIKILSTTTLVSSSIARYAVAGVTIPSSFIQPQRSFMNSKFVQKENDNDDDENENKNKPKNQIDGKPKKLRSFNFKFKQSSFITTDDFVQEIQDAVHEKGRPLMNELERLNEKVDKVQLITNEEEKAKEMVALEQEFRDLLHKIDNEKEPEELAAEANLPEKTKEIEEGSKKKELKKFHFGFKQSSAASKLAKLQQEELTESDSDADDDSGSDIDGSDSDSDADDNDDESDSDIDSELEELLKDIDLSDDSDDSDDSDNEESGKVIETSASEVPNTPVKPQQPPKLEQKPPTNTSTTSSTTSSSTSIKDFALESKLLFSPESYSSKLTYTLSTRINEFKSKYPEIKNMKRANNLLDSWSFLIDKFSLSDMEVIYFMSFYFNARLLHSPEAISENMDKVTEIVNQMKAERKTPLQMKARVVEKSKASAAAAATTTTKPPQK